MMTESYHDHEADALPQAGKKRLMHTEKRGPAFDGIPAGRTPVTALAMALTANGLEAAGEMLEAIDTHDLCGLIHAWRRLRQTLNLPPLALQLTSSRPVAIRWDSVQDTLVRSLCLATQPGFVHWITVDSAIRALARHSRHGVERELDRELQLTEAEVYEDGCAARLRARALDAELSFLDEFIDGRVA